MKRLPVDIGIIHIVGIGGIGMSGIAEVLHNLGYSVQGSDVALSANVKRLQKLGIPVMIGHSAANVEHARVVVVSSAIKSGNPEVDGARERKIPVVKRSEMLAELMRLKSCVSIAGTHGKTTTTSLIATLLDAAEFDPTVINGGIINAYGTNARLGAGDWMVVEADESDGTFVKIPATIAVVTNIDPEHLDFYGSYDAIKAAFLSFVENIPFYGAAVLCIDHPVVQSMIPSVTDRRVITYGFSPQSDVRCTDLRYEAGIAVFDVSVSGPEIEDVVKLNALSLPMPGRHNVQNALATIAVGMELGIGWDVIAKAFKGFTGVKRRFTRVGEVDGIVIIDDYGHHPVEIKAVLAAAREANEGRVIAVVQPHRYTRLHDLFEDFCTAFNQADTVIVAPVYTAGESPIEGADRDGLVEGLKSHGHRRALALSGPEALPRLIQEEADKGDMVVLMGAGDITHWANDLPKALSELKAGGAS